MTATPALPTTLRPTTPRRWAALAAALALPVALATVTATGSPSDAAGPVTVNCDTGDSLAAAVRAASPGTTITVTGTCVETVHVPRTATQLTIDGQGSAVVSGPAASTPATSPASFTFFVEGNGITLRNLTIEGGAHGVHLSGPAFATVENAVIRGSGGAIHLDKNSAGQVVGSTIVDNQGYGINVQENSYARVGFTAPTRGLVPNVIRDNQGPGIIVQRDSSAWVAGNTIADNGADGVLVDRMSQADVLGNVLEGNGGDGIVVRNGSGVNLSSEEPEQLREVGPNTTSPASPNEGVALRCEVDSYLTGPRGTLAGAAGLKAIDRPSCTDATTPAGRG
jgi:hypothetical protein